MDFADHNLHVVNYSEPVSTALSLEELRPRLHVNSRNPDWIPYKTSYYKRNWGFWLFLLSNLLWIAWGFHDKAYALIFLQFCLAFLNIRGTIKNNPG